MAERGMRQGYISEMSDIMVIFFICILVDGVLTKERKW
jgi:hypothetical protein